MYSSKKFGSKVYKGLLRTHICSAIRTISSNHSHSEEH